MRKLKFKSINCKTLFKGERRKNFCEIKIEEKGIIKKIKNSFKKYGKFGLAIYSIYYVAGFAGFYYLIESDVIKLDHIVKTFEFVGLNKFIDVRQKVKDHPKSANLVMAYLINYLFETVRIPTTLLFLKYYFKKYKK